MHLETTLTQRAITGYLTGLRGLVRRPGSPYADGIPVALAPHNGGLALREGYEATNTRNGTHGTVRRDTRCRDLAATLLNNIQP